MKKLFLYSRVKAVARKEVMHIMRDPFTLGLAVGLPAVLVVFFGFAIDFNFRDVKIAVYDFDNSRYSRQFLETFAGSGYFSLRQGGFPAMPELDVESEKAFASIVVKPGFGRKISSGEPAAVQILMDGTDNQKTGVVNSYFSGILEFLASKFYEGGVINPIKTETRFVYNPELNSRWFIVPGLIVVVIGLISILMTALTVAREWENGSMELLLSTPVAAYEVVLGKIIPYIFIVFVSVVFVYLSALFVFDIPFRGSIILLSIACILFILVSLAQGVLISVITRQQQKAMQLALLMGLLPSLLMSGFIFPVENMPVFFRYFTMILPPRWFMDIIRPIFLKGAAFTQLIKPFAVLFFMGFMLILAAAKASKKDIEP